MSSKFPKIPLWSCSLNEFVVIIVFVFVFLVVFLLVMLCLLITLSKSLNDRSLKVFSKCICLYHCICLYICICQFFLVRSCCLTTLIKCLKGHKYLGLLFKGVL